MTTATELIKWIISEGINGEQLTMLNVPEPGEFEWEQNEDWWMFMVGGVPPYEIPSGEYIMYYYPDIDSGLKDYEIETRDGFIHLIRLDK